MKKLLLLTLAALFVSFVPRAANPAEEVRAVWLTTNSSLDWPSTGDEAKQKAELTALLDKLQAANFNTIIFQVQVKGDVAWKSKIQPAMYSFTRNGANKLSYDVCSYVIEECHKRNMECHAWIVPYRIGTLSEAKKYASNPVKHPSVTHPELCVAYNNALYLDPGFPKTTEYLVELYRELVTQNDFDGINFDYTRYPGKNFDDTESYNRYGVGDKDNWRRANVNNMVKAVYQMVKQIKPWMKVGAAPIGTYYNVTGYANMTAYYDVYQDAAGWMKGGYHDLLIPQEYWNEKYGFSPNMETWVKESAGRQLVIGLAPYKMLDSNNWEYTVITDQIEKVRKNSGTSGVCFFRTDNITGSEPKVIQLYNALKNDYFNTPAKIPVMSYMETTTPNPPVNPALEGTTLSWGIPELDNAGTPLRSFAIYRKTAGKVDTDNAESIVAIVNANTASFKVPDASAEYAVTTIDRNNCESIPSEMSSVGTVVSDNFGITVAGGIITVSYSGDDAVLTLHNAAGSAVAAASGSTLDASYLNPGIYILSIKTAGSSAVRKIKL